MGYRVIPSFTTVSLSYIGTLTEQLCVLISKILLFMHVMHLASLNTGVNVKYISHFIGIMHKFPDGLSRNLVPKFGSPNIPKVLE